jgi:hypothetical protein
MLSLVLTPSRRQHLQRQWVDVAAVSLCCFWHEEPDVDGALDVVIQPLVGAVVVANALGLTVLTILITGECSSNECIQLLVDFC